MKLIDAVAGAITRLVLLVVAAVVTLVFVCLALLGLVFVLIKALLTGRKPEFVTSFMRFRQASQQFNRGDWRGYQSTDSAHSNRTHDSTSTNGDIIEGQATEIRDDASLPHKPE